jgi:excisionase family DNA binding protein
MFDYYFALRISAGGGTLPTFSNDEWLDYKGASLFIDAAVGTLQVWICSGRYAIPYYKIGRKVRFKKSELTAWMETRKRGGTTPTEGSK